MIAQVSMLAECFPCHSMGARRRWALWHAPGPPQAGWFFVTRGRPGPMAGRFPGPMRAVGLAGGLGFVLAAMTILGAWVGYYLDGRWGTGPWLTVVGTICGAGAGLLEVVSVLKQVRGDK